jgi:hypothetical protein
MADPLDVLLDTGGSTEPDPAFRQELMARVGAALGDFVDSTHIVPSPSAQAEGRDEVHIFEIDHRMPGDRGGRHRTRWLTLAAAVLAAIGVGLLVQLALRDVGEKPPIVPTTNPPQTSAPTPSPITAAPDRPCPNPDGGYLNHCLGALDPGAYRTTTFEPSFRYSVPAGWWNVEDTSGNYVLLPSGESLSRFRSGMSDYVGVYSSVAAPAGCDEYPDSSIATTVQAYLGWLEAQPSLVVSAPKPVVVGGLDGTQVDVSLSSEPACSDPDVVGPFMPVLLGTNTSLLGYEPGKRSDRVDSNTRLRLILFDRPGTLMVIELADTQNLDGDDGWWTTAAEITTTFEFDP